MYYLLDFTKHQFISCENASVVEAKIRSLMASGCSQDFIEIINGYGDGTRLDVNEFRDQCAELGLVNNSVVDFLVERESTRTVGTDAPKLPAEPSISLWARLGILVNVTPEELALLKDGDRTVAEDLFVGLVRSDRCSMSGDTYFPLDCNEEFIGDMEDDLAFDLDCSLHDKGGRQVVVSPEKIEAAMQCLVDNGIEHDEAESVLQALGYILLDNELLPGVKEAENRPALDDAIANAERLSGPRSPDKDDSALER